VLEVRILGVMNPIISDSQTTFLKDMNLVEAVLVIDKVVDFAKEFIRSVLIYKFDLLLSLSNCDKRRIERKNREYRTLKPGERRRGREKNHR
jgi:hypothetical protein